MVQIVADGQMSFEGGQDSSLPPARLPENRYAAGVNVTTEQGTLRPRYGYERKSISFQAGGYSYKFNKIINFRELFQQGNFQAAAPYLLGSKWHLIIVISGVIYLVDVADWSAIILTRNTETQLDATSKRINWTVAGKYLVLHDFPSRPIIVEGFVARRSRYEEFELPPCRLGAFNQSRMFFANAANDFSAGDPVGNAATPDAPITVYEIELSGSPYFADVYQIPSKYNSPITAMATLQSVDSSTGIGALVVSTEKELFAYNTVAPRDDWGAGKFGSSVSDQAGIVGPRAICNVNSDLFFISGDGELRSLSAAQNEQKKWARVPMSVEVREWTKYASPELLQYTCLAYFRNKIFWAVRPFRTFSTRFDGVRVLDIAHAGIAVLELDNVSRAGSDSNPAWAGLWTGVRPLDFVVCGERMFIISKDNKSYNAVYEVDPEISFDRTTCGQRRPVRSVIYTREHLFKDPFAIKRLHSVEMGVTKIQGNFKLKIEWKPSHSETFLPWADFDHEVPSKYIYIENNSLQERLPLSFRELKFGLPDVQSGHPVTQDLFSSVKRVQLRISIYADNWQLNEYQILAAATPENTTEFLPDNLPIVTEVKQEYSDWTYEEFSLDLQGRDTRSEPL
jgi:hypothetical protein